MVPVGPKPQAACSDTAERSVAGAGWARRAVGDSVQRTRQVMRGVPGSLVGVKGPCARCRRCPGGFAAMATARLCPLLLGVVVFPRAAGRLSRLAYGQSRRPGAAGRRSDGSGTGGTGPCAVRMSRYATSASVYRASGSAWLRPSAGRRIADRVVSGRRSRVQTRTRPRGTGLPQAARGEHGKATVLLASLASALLSAPLLRGHARLYPCEHEEEYTHAEADGIPDAYEQVPPTSARADRYDGRSG